MAELFREVLHDPPHVNIGKNGITSNVVTHILELIKTKKILKIKVLKEAVHLFGIETVVSQLQQQCRLVILDVRGFTIIVAKKPIPGIRSPKKYNLSEEQKLTNSQDSSLELPITEEIHTTSENLTIPPKTLLNSFLDEPTQLEHIETSSQQASLQLNPDFIDYDNLELMTELNHLEESIQTTRRSNRKATRPRSLSIQGKKSSKKATKKSQSSKKSHI